MFAKTLAGPLSRMGLHYGWVADGGVRFWPATATWLHYIWRRKFRGTPMIVEFWTYRLKPDTVAPAEESFGNAI
jgi:hypothetical protein